MKHSIYNRWLIYILSVTILFLLFISLANYWWAHNVVVELSERHASASADVASVRIQSYLKEKGQNAWTLAQNEQIHAFVKRVSTTQDIDLSTDATHQQMLTSFRRITEENSDIKFVYVAVEATQRLYGNIEFVYPKNYDVTKRPWYQQASKTDGIIYTAPYICPLTGNYVVTAAKAFYDDNGNLLGVAAVDVLVGKIQQIVSELHIFKDDYAFLMDADGEIIVNLKDGDYRKQIMELEDAQSQMRSIFSQMISGHRGMTKVDLDNVEKYVLFSPVEDIGWSMGFVVPVSEVTSSVYDLGKIFFITLIIGIIVISVLVSFLTAKITQPLNSFSKLMERVGEGDYTLRAPVTSEDELGQLAVSLNTMLDKQQSLIEQVIDTSYKMSLAGQELAITIGEARITLPMVTVNMGYILSKSESFEHIPEEQQNNEKTIRELTEQAILLMHTQRNITSRLQNIKLMADGDNLEHDKFIQGELLSALQEIEAQCQQSGEFIENIQLGLSDLSTIINHLTYNYDDIQSTFQKVSKSLGVLADLQSDSIDRATKTATQLLDWSHILMEYSSLFRIKKP